MRRDCPVCLPLKHALDNRNRAQGSVRGIESAYEALGITLATNGEPRLQPYPVGAHANLLRSDPSMQLTADNRSFGETSVTATSTTASGNRGPKEWHQHVTPDLRNHLVHKL